LWITQRPGALDAVRRAAAINPSYAEARNNLGVMLAALGRNDLAAAEWRCAVQSRPGFAAAWTNLGSALMDEAKLDEALSCYRHAATLDLSSPACHNLLYALH